MYLNTTLFQNCYKYEIKKKIANYFLTVSIESFPAGIVFDILLIQPQYIYV